MKTLLLAAIFAAASALQAAAAHKLPLPEFQTPDQLVQWRRETMEKACAADALAASTSASPVFYTGKPYLEETGSYAFLFRQYDPELSRWNTFDPSGFPDGANNSRYAATPTTGLDWQGLLVINSFSDALRYWRRPSGSPSDTVQAGSSIINAIKSSGGFADLILRIQTQRIQPQLLLVNPDEQTGSLADGPQSAPADIGFVDNIIGRTSISYSDTSTWDALTSFYNNGNSVGRDLKATTVMNADFSDVWDFTSHLGDSWWMDMVGEKIPEKIAGPGTPFNIDGLFTHTFETYAWQLE